MKLRYIYILLVMVVALGACDPNDTIEDYKTETTSIGAMLAGEWYVTYTDIATGDEWDFSKITTYNTAENTDKMWIVGSESYWDFKRVVDVNVEENTFSIEGVDGDNNALYVKNGQVFPGLGTTDAGNVTDSIYMEVEFASRGMKMILAGVRRTGFLEDEHE